MAKIAAAISQETESTQRLVDKIGTQLPDSHLADLPIDSDALLMPILAAAVREAKGNPSALKRLAFEFAALILFRAHVPKSSFDKEVSATGKYKEQMLRPSGLMRVDVEVHHYAAYKETMAVIGAAAVIIGEYNKRAKEWFNHQPPTGREERSWNDPNDPDRNQIRLSGFFRDEGKADTLLKCLKEQSKHKHEPWNVDLQLALLEVLEAIDYRTPLIAEKTVKALQALRKNKKISPIIGQRIEQVIDSIENHPAKPYVGDAHKTLIREFEDFIDQNSLKTGSRLLSIYEDAKSKIPINEYALANSGELRFDNKALKKYCSEIGRIWDRIDSLEGKPFTAKDFEVSRIDYDAALAMVLGDEFSPAGMMQQNMPAQVPYYPPVESAL